MDFALSIELLYKVNWFLLPTEEQTIYPDDAIHTVAAMYSLLLGTRKWPRRLLAHRFAVH